MECTIRELRIGNPEDAAGLAAMWNASDAEWPGGWTHGVPETAERVLENTRKLDRLAIFVAEVDGQIAGYCDLRREYGRDDVAYVPLLNVRPDCHGKGLGKALLLKALERTVEHGCRQLTLGTWAGNLKAVPLYKKTGFFWVPETSVWMQNYIPLALSVPAGRDFFAAHDWYRSFRRELAVAPDEVEWNGIKVFPYHFEAEGDHFALWVDRQAEAPTAVETADFAVACIVGAEEVVCGLPHPVRWEIASKRGPGGRPLQVTLMAEGEEGVGLSVAESLTVRDTVAIERMLTLSPEVKRKEPGLPAHQLRSTLLIDGVPVVLGTAVKPAQAVEIQYDGEVLVPGKPEQEIVVRLKSNLDFPVRGDLLVEPHPALRFGSPKAEFRLQPRSWTSCTFRVDALQEGAFATRVRAVCVPTEEGAAPAGTRLATKAKTVTFRTLPFESLYTWHDDEGEAIVVETPLLWARFRTRGGEVSIHDRDTGRQLLSLSAPDLGPPFVGWRRVPPLYAHRVETRDGKAIVTQTFPWDRAPGTAIERTLTLGAGDCLRVDHVVTNGSDTAHRLKLQAPASSDLNGKVTAPLRAGLLHEPFEGWGGFPLWEGDLPEKPDAYAESWFAVEEAGFVAGIVRGACGECNRMGLQIDLPELPAGACLRLDPIYLIAGRGNWERVRQLWRRLKQPGTVREERKPIVSPALSVTLAPAPLLLLERETPAVLAVRSLRDKALSGSLAISAEGMRVAPDRAEITNIASGTPFEAGAVVRVDSLAPRVETARISLTDDAQVREFRSPVVVLGDRLREVSVSPRGDGREALFTLDNGCLVAEVAPGFLGSVTSLARDGVSFLESAYPEARARSWMNPWFGGIHPILNWPGDRRLSKERFTGSPVERRGGRGIAWRGVAVTADLEHKDLRWLRMEVEYLTVGGSNVLAVVQRLVNRTDAPQGIQAGIGAWVAAGGRVEGNVLHLTRKRPRYQQGASTEEQERVAQRRLRSQYSAELPCGRWAAVEQAETGGALALVVPHPDSALWAVDEGKEGVMLQALGWLRIEPGQSKEMVTWVVLATSTAEVGEYRALAEVWVLP